MVIAVIRPRECPCKIAVATECWAARAQRPVPAPIEHLTRQVPCAKRKAPAALTNDLVGVKQVTRAFGPVHTAPAHRVWIDSCRIADLQQPVAGRKGSLRSFEASLQAA